MNPDLQDKLDKLPARPGVYLLKEATGRILYAGKAKNLRKRVLSYFGEKSHGSAKTQVMLSRTEDIDVIVTGTEKEAVILEASLIKKHRPRYNVLLRDDKDYLALRLDPKEKFPRLSFVRRFKKDGALYFGPFASARAVRETVKVLNRTFPLRQCSNRKFRHRQHPCLNYQLGRCLGVCSGTVSPEEYAGVVEQAVLFLKGRTRHLQDRLQAEMEKAAAAQEFEKAAVYRDRLRAIEQTLERQHVASPEFRKRDVIGVCQDSERMALAVLFVRGGRVVDSRVFDFERPQGGQSEAVRAFIQQYYDEGRALPEEILISDHVEEQELLAEWLTELRGERLNLRVPRRGEARHLVAMAVRNASNRLESRRRKEADLQSALQRLQDRLNLDSLPQRLECVDISNIQGRFAVGSLVVFQAGEPDKSAYRRYRIKGLDRSNDPAMMAEVLARRFTDTRGSQGLPDLLVLDGGKGQLNQALAVLRELDLEGRVPVVGLAKESRKTRRDVSSASEKLYLPGRKNPLLLKNDPVLLLVLDRLRDEAHRFAITYYQKRHRKGTLQSVLDGVPGVGPKRRQLLMGHFGSVRELAGASVEELQRLPGINEHLAQKIHAAMQAAKQNRVSKAAPTGDGGESSLA
ncbi:MAG: excinuclease ABC subunit UvrC [Syntrophobacteria bacterium]